MKVFKREEIEMLASHEGWRKGDRCCAGLSVICVYNERELEGAVCLGPPCCLCIHFKMSDTFDLISDDRK